MTSMDSAIAHHPATFPQTARAAFAKAYPDQPVKLSHDLVGHNLLTLDALARLAERMPAASVEYNLGKLPLGVRPEDTVEGELLLVQPPPQPRSRMRAGGGGSSRMMKPIAAR